MNKKALIIIPLVFVCCIITFTLFAGGENNNLVLSVYDRKVALFENSDQDPKQVYDIYIDSLPEKDRENLIQGIKIESESQLAQLLEDFDE